MDNRTIDEIRRNEDRLINEIELLEKENRSLKKQLEVGKEQYNDLVEEKEKLEVQLSSNTLQLDNQQKEFIEYLETEKDRLARECSQIYENGFGRVRLVSEDVHDEISRILEKYKEIIGEEM